MPDEQDIISSPTTQDVSQSTSSMPPITRPEDFLADMRDTGTTEASADTLSFGSDIPQDVPTAPISAQTGQVFAPMPSMPESPVVPTTVSRGVPREPVISRPKDPAMPPDPLYVNTESSDTEAAADGVSIPHVSNEYTHRNDRKVPNKHAKTIIFSTIAIVLVGLSVGGFFGYRAYLANVRMKALAEAVDYFFSVPSVSSDIKITEKADSITGTLQIDEKKSLKFTTNDKNTSMGAVYLDDRDKLYISGSSASLTAKNYFEFSNVSSPFGEIWSDDASLAKQISTSDSKKYVKYIGTESIDGVDSYKYTISPTDDISKKLLTGNSSTKTMLGYNLSETKLLISVWVAKDTHRMSQLVVSAKVKSAGKRNTTDRVYGMTLPDTIDLDLVYTQGFDYSYKDTVKLPIGAKTSIFVEPVEAKEAAEPAVVADDTPDETDDTPPASGQNKASDDAKIAIIDRYVAAMEAYMADNEAYPEAADVASLQGALTGGDKVYLAGDTAMSGITYAYDAESGEYTFKFLLSNQSLEGDNVQGESPQKYYVVTL